MPPFWNDDTLYTRYTAEFENKIKSNEALSNLILTYASLVMCNQREKQFSHHITCRLYSSSYFHRIYKYIYDIYIYILCMLKLFLVEYSRHFTGTFQIYFLIAQLQKYNR